MGCSLLNHLLISDVARCPLLFRWALQTAIAAKRRHSYYTRDGILPEQENDHFPWLHLRLQGLADGEWWLAKTLQTDRALLWLTSAFVLFSFSGFWHLSCVSVLEKYIYDGRARCTSSAPQRSLANTLAHKDSSLISLLHT